MRLILASSSPRRRELLVQVGLVFDVMPAHIFRFVAPSIEEITLDPAETDPETHKPEDNE